MLFQQSRGAGPPGPPGRDGHDGTPGRDGTPGSTGPPGPSGPQGLGLPGRDGLPGAKGEIGVGAPGSKGATGDVGSEGPKGEVGSTGSPGLKGEEGESNLFGASVFSAYKTNGGVINTGVLTFDVVVVGSDVLNKDSGFFTCKIGGTYIFTFSGEARSSSSDYIGVYLNNVRQMILYDNDDRPHSNVSFTWTMVIEQGDQVQLKIDYGSFYVDADGAASRLYFNGFLLKPSA